MDRRRRIRNLSAHLAEFGLALGLGFQVQDDLLGTFGAASDTGKAAADDIRRKKQSLPVLLLRQSAGPDDRERLAAIYHRAEIDPGAVTEVLELMGRHEIEAQVRETVTRYHDRAVFRAHRDWVGRSRAGSADGPYPPPRVADNLIGRFRPQIIRTLVLRLADALAMAAFPCVRTINIYRP